MSSLKNSGPDCRCQRSACMKNYCRCYNANRKCGESCKCIGKSKNSAIFSSLQIDAIYALFLLFLFHITEGCKNVLGSKGTTKRPKTEQIGNSVKVFTEPLADAITNALLAKSAMLIASGKGPTAVEKEVLLEFNNCLNAVINHLHINNY